MTRTKQQQKNHEKITAFFDQYLPSPRPWSSASEYYIPTHVVIWVLIIFFTLWLNSNGGSVESPMYIDPIVSETTERLT
jgi:hypothetical protein